MFRILTLVFSLVFTQQSQAQSSNPNNPRSKSFDDYYTISETASKTTPNLQPFEALRDFVANNETFTSLKVQVLNLLNFEHHKETFGRTAEAYQRLKHFGTWLRDSQRCMNTRAYVLIRDSQEEVSYSAGGAGCSVATGVWHDPYTNNIYTKASDIQIDHVVALKNAYVSGASKWSNQHRCLYANFLGNDFHLMSVDGPENMKKSAKGPEKYMPPNSAFQCEYLQAWVRIKLIWELGLNPNEAETVQRLAKDNNCEGKGFIYSAVELQKQRAYIQNNLSICANK